MQITFFGFQTWFLGYVSDSRELFEGFELWEVFKGRNVSWNDEFWHRYQSLKNQFKLEIKLRTNNGWKSWYQIQLDCLRSCFLGHHLKIGGSEACLSWRWVEDQCVWETTKIDLKGNRSLFELWRLFSQTEQFIFLRKRKMMSLRNSAREWLSHDATRNSATEQDDHRESQWQSIAGIS